MQRQFRGMKAGRRLSLRTLGQDFPGAGMGTMLLMGHFQLAWRETFLSKDKN